MDVTEVRISMQDSGKLKAFANITFDNAFVIRGLKVIDGAQGVFVAMPSRKRANGTYQDTAHPVNNTMRKHIEGRVLNSFNEAHERNISELTVSFDENGTAIIVEESSPDMQT